MRRSICFEVYEEEKVCFPAEWIDMTSCLEERMRVKWREGKNLKSMYFLTSDKNREG